jgi:hypothetical protein
VHTVGTRQHASNTMHQQSTKPSSHSGGWRAACLLTSLRCSALNAFLVPADNTPNPNMQQSKTCGTVFALVRVLRACFTASESATLPYVIAPAARHVRLSSPAQCRAPGHAGTSCWTLKPHSKRIQPSVNKVGRTHLLHNTAAVLPPFPPLPSTHPPTPTHTHTVCN